MKKTTILLLLIVAAMQVSAQRKFDPARFKADLHRYITVEAALTQAEAEKFFPLYDEMKDKQRELHRASHAFFRQNANSDAACRSLIVQRDKAELQMKVIEKKYHEKFLQVLPPMKVYKILYAEAKFHRQAFKKAAQKDD